MLLELDINRDSLVLNVVFKKDQAELFQEIDSNQANKLHRIFGTYKSGKTKRRKDYRVKIVRDWDIYQKSDWSNGIRWIFGKKPVGCIIVDSKSNS